MNLFQFADSTVKYIDNSPGKNPICEDPLKKIVNHLSPFFLTDAVSKVK